MFDLAFYRMISKATNLVNENYKQIYQTYSKAKRQNRYDEANFLIENALYLRQYAIYFS